MDIKYRFSNYRTVYHQIQLLYITHVRKHTRTHNTHAYTYHFIITSVMSVCILCLPVISLKRLIILLCNSVEVLVHFKRRSRSFSLASFNLMISSSRSFKSFSNMSFLFRRHLHLSFYNYNMHILLYNL